MTDPTVTPTMITPERLAEIRTNRALESDLRAWDDIDDLLAHVDALTAERDAARTERDDARAKLAAFVGNAARLVRSQAIAAGRARGESPAVMSAMLADIERHADQFAAGLDRIVAGGAR